MKHIGIVVKMFMLNIDLHLTFIPHLFLHPVCSVLGDCGGAPEHAEPLFHEP